MDTVAGIKIRHQPLNDRGILVAVLRSCDAVACPLKNGSRCPIDPPRCKRHLGIAERVHCHFDQPLGFGMLIGKRREARLQRVGK